MAGGGIDWAALREAAVTVMRQAYAPYSGFPVGAAGLVDDGRVVVGCNVENAAFGVVLCAECGVVGALHASGGGRLVALSCVDGSGAPLMPCGRCRQLLWEQGGPACLVDAEPAPIPMADLLPYAFGEADLNRIAGPATGRSTGPASHPMVPAGSRQMRGRGTVVVHQDSVGGQRVWTAYWERTNGFESSSDVDDDGPAGASMDRGIIEEGPTWTDLDQAVAWGRARTPRVVIVEASGALRWAGTGPAPQGFGEGEAASR